MAKQDYIIRYLTIIKKLRKGQVATFKEISDYLEKESQFYDRPFLISMRTFQRDLNEIRSIFKVDIQYDFSRKVYYIADDQQSDLSNRMLESIDTLNSLKIADDVSKYMFFEKRKSQGTQHFYGLLHAIKNRFIINLVHQKFWDDEPTKRLLAPLALKESKGRWYLLAKEPSSKKVKTFGLDRVIEFDITPKIFEYPADFDAVEQFKYCFGVINPDESTPQEIILSFTFEQGKYIKSYPIHDSQTSLFDTADEFRISLRMFITHDFIMEILSYGESVSIISPRSLAKQIIEIHRDAISNTMNHEVL
jgi:predicted DNA-binding transcriptional regulator YafY